MKKLTFKKLLIIFISILLSSCTSVQNILSSENSENGMDQINQLLDEKIGKVDQNNKEMRLFRAQLLIAMFARYGAARFEDYSDDPANDATKLLGRISVAEKAIQAAKDDYKNNPFYPVARADIILATLNVFTVAIKPTVRGSANLILPSSTSEKLKKGKVLLENALKTKLYASAYKHSFKNLNIGSNSEEPTAAAPSKEDWVRVDEFIIQACGDLREIAQVDLSCMKSDTIQKTAAN